MAKRDGGGFAGQEGYCAFSVSASQTGDVIRYIKNQAAHHAKKSFEQEFLEFLERCGITYAPAQCWGDGVSSGHAEFCRVPPGRGGPCLPRLPSAEALG